MWIRANVHRLSPCSPCITYHLSQKQNTWTIVTFTVNIKLLDVFWFEVWPSKSFILAWDFAYCFIMWQWWIHIMCWHEIEIIRFDVMSYLKNIEMNKSNFLFLISSYFYIWFISYLHISFVYVHCVHVFKLKKWTTKGLSHITYHILTLEINHLRLNFIKTKNYKT